MLTDKLWKSVWKSKAPLEIKAGFILSLLFSFSDKEGAKAIVDFEILEYEIGVEYIYAMDELESKGYVEKIEDGYIIGRYTKKGEFKFLFNGVVVSDDYDIKYISSNSERLLSSYKTMVGELAYMRYATQIQSKFDFFIREAKKDRLKPTYLAISLNMCKSMALGLRNVNFKPTQKEVFTAKHILNSFSSHTHLLALSIYYVQNFKKLSNSYANEINIYTFKILIDKTQEHYESTKRQSTGSIRGA